MAVAARGADAYLPQRRDLTSLRRAATDCHGCDLYRAAEQTVFGAGEADASMMLVGEQPGDREDRAGEPFVGPAGRLLDRALHDASIARDRVYLTNAVKHFKFTVRGKRRIHQKPGRTEIVACRPWLLAEIDEVQPRVLVLLGATAAQSLLGSTFRVTAHRGEELRLGDDPHHTAQPAVFATIHPSAVLRGPAEDRDDALAALVADLRRAARGL